MPWNRDSEQKNCQIWQVSISPGDIQSLGGSLARSARALQNHPPSPSPLSRAVLRTGAQTEPTRGRTLPLCCCLFRSDHGAPERGEAAPVEAGSGEGLAASAAASLSACSWTSRWRSLDLLGACWWVRQMHLGVGMRGGASGERGCVQHEPRRFTYERENRPEAEVRRR